MQRVVPGLPKNLTGPAEMILNTPVRKENMLCVFFSAGCFLSGSVPDTGRYNDTELKILRFFRKGVGCGEGKNLFSREKKDNGADVRPPPRDTIDPCREPRVLLLFSKKPLSSVDFFCSVCYITNEYKCATPDKKETQ